MLLDRPNCLATFASTTNSLRQQLPMPLSPAKGSGWQDHAESALHRGHDRSSRQSFDAGRSGENHGELHRIGAGAIPTSLTLGFKSKNKVSMAPHATKFCLDTTRA